MDVAMMLILSQRCSAGGGTSSAAMPLPKPLVSPACTLFPAHFGLFLRRHALSEDLFDLRPSLGRNLFRQITPERR
jgi:hypothetical protein